MSPETSESPSEEHVNDEVTVFHSNPSSPPKTCTIKVSATSVCKAVDENLHKSAQLAKRGAHKTAKVTKASIRHSVSAGRALCLRHPRIFSILYGVLLPLWLIIFVSLGFGYFLSLVEAPNEVRANDSYLAARDEVRMISWLAANYTRSLPLLCFDQYMRIKANLTQDTDANIQASISDAFDTQTTFSQRARQFTFNETEIGSTELTSFMSRCGRISSPTTEQLIKRALSVSRELDGKLSFNWMRCYEGASGYLRGQSKLVKNVELLTDFKTCDMLHNTTFMSSNGKKDRQEKFELLVETHLKEENITLEMAQSRAMWETATMATGGDACGFNSAASAFFFFTIMTTVGYGNQTPSTDVGRALVISFGFIGILMFGLILARAGKVMSAILDDFLGRIHPAFITRPWVSFLFWAGAYWGWMVAQAEFYMRWKEGRLDEPFDYEDAFWFAFLTSTTVGLGDFYVDPEVIIVSDLLWIPAVILVDDRCDKHDSSARRKRKDLIDEMLDQLISEENPKGEPTFTESDNSTDSPRNDESESDSVQQNSSRQDLDDIDEVAIQKDAETP